MCVFCSQSQQHPPCPDAEQAMTSITEEVEVEYSVYYCSYHCESLLMVQDLSKQQKFHPKKLG